MVGYGLGSFVQKRNQHRTLSESNIENSNFHKMLGIS
jgi:hypothetical protein